MLKTLFDEKKKKKVNVYQEVSAEELLIREEDAREVSQAMKSLRQERAQLAAERAAARKNLWQGNGSGEKKERMKDKQRKERESKAAWKAAKEEKYKVAQESQQRARSKHKLAALRTVRLPAPWKVSTRLSLQENLMRRPKLRPRQKR